MNTVHSLLIRAGNFWWVNDKVGEKDGLLRAKVASQEELLPPPSGWKYYYAGWKSDPSMICSREVTPACAEVSVELSGRAKKKHPEYAGRYLLMEGKRQRGRWVGSHQQTFSLI